MEQYNEHQQGENEKVNKRRNRAQSKATPERIANENI